jgi:hypothetical protein
MIIFPAQFESFRTRGHDNMRIINLSTYEEHADEVSKIVNGKLGQEYIVMMIPTNTDEQKTFTSETPDETKNRFWKQMHALITDIAELKGVKPDEWKETMKQSLKQEGKIKESTKELDIQQLASVIIRLKRYKYELERKGTSF